MDDDTQKSADLLTSSLLDTKKKHDQDKTVTKEEVDYLNKGTDYLSSFLTGQGIELEERVPTKEKPLSEDELKNKGNMLIFAFAGHDTTGHTLTWLLYELCKQPILKQELIKEIDKISDQEIVKLEIPTGAPIIYRYSKDEQAFIKD